MKPALFGVVVLLAHMSAAATDFASPESPNDFASPGSRTVLEAKLSWYADNWQSWKAAFYNCKDPEERRRIRDQYIDARLDVLNELFRKFVSNTYGRSTALSATSDTVATGVGVAGAAAGTTVIGRVLAAAGAIFLGTTKKLYDGFEIKLTLTKLQAIREARIQNILRGKSQSAEKYDMIDAEQDMSDLELSSMLSAASEGVEAIKRQALEKARDPKAPESSASAPVDSAKAAMPTEPSASQAK